MYFPKGFNSARSIELAELICQAYAQFDAFESGKPWKLPGKYALRTEFTYLWVPGRSIEKGIRNFDLILRRLSRSRQHKDVKIPIGFVAQRKENYFLILRGTETVNEWIRNISISLSSFAIPKYGRVHGGFLQTYKAVRKDIMEALSRIDLKAKLYVAGHSLGGDLTTLALPDIEANLNRKVSALYTYGSPRVGDNTFVTAFNRAFGHRSFRVANTSDIVTSIPLPGPIARIVGGYFSHVDTPVDLTVQKDDLEQNHDMKTYLSALNEEQGHKGFIGKLFEQGV
jgi:triacylglycerol lipase